MSHDQGHPHERREQGRDHKSRWIRSLTAEGLEYRIRILEEVAEDDGPALGLIERFWIAQAKEAGWRLTNATDGGDGAPGLRHSAETKARISEAKRGTRASEVTRARISASRTGVPLAAEHRRRVVEATRAYWTGRKHSASSLAKMRASHSGRRPSADTRAKISAAVGGRPVLDLTSGITYRTAVEAAKAIGASPALVNNVLHGRGKSGRGHRLVFAPPATEERVNA